MDLGPTPQPNADTLDLRTGIWISAPTLPDDPAEPGIAHFRGSLYAVGGSMGGLLSDASNHVYRLSLMENSWERLNDYPQAVWGVALGTLGDSLFAVGGTGFGLDAGGRLVFKYDPDADQWLSRPGLPESRSDAAVASVGGKLVVLGGTAVGGLSFPPGTTLIFDSETGSWSTGAPMSDRMTGPGATAIDGLIYVAGGTRIDDFSEPDSRIRVYDPAADTWTILAGPPLLSRSHAGMGFLDGRIHLFGGIRGNTRPTDTHVAYVISEGAWYRYPPLPFEARGVRAGTLGDGLVVMEAWWDAHTPPSATGFRFRATEP